MSELAYSSAVAIAKKIRQREISSREAVDYFLACVEALDKRINSVVTIDAERARTEADAADAALAHGEVRGPLHGVPMTIKDSFQTAGMRTTSGAPELAEFIPKEDAWPVARLREAGAIVFGKTNLPIYAGDLQSQRSLRYNEQSLRSVVHPGRLIRRVGCGPRVRIHSSGTRKRPWRFDSSAVSYVDRHDQTPEPW